MRTIVAFLIIFSLLALSSCDDLPRQPSSGLPEVGTRAVIKQHSFEIISEVVDITDNLVTFDYFWNGEKVYSQKYYKGLFSVWSQEENAINEIDYDPQQLDALFPLSVGKEISFNTVLSKVTEGVRENLSVTLSVVKETILPVDGEDHKVFIIDVARLSENGQRQYATLYYSAVDGMVLKSVSRSSNSQSFWRVLKLERPDNNNRPTIRKRKRRSGTIAI